MELEILWSYEVLVLVVCVVVILLSYKTLFCNPGICISKVRLDGKTVLITGANTGIGKETAIDLAKRGATVYIGCRNADRGQAALKCIKQASDNQHVYLRILDLASFASIREFAAKFNADVEDLHILINNAGIMMCPFQETQDGLEMQMGVNHFGHFLLTSLLLEKLQKSAPSRIINVSSHGHMMAIWGVNEKSWNDRRSYNRVMAYAQSKLANILFTKELSLRFSAKGVSSFALHPGGVHTELGRHFFTPNGFVELLLLPFLWLTAKTPVQGAQTSIFCAVEEGLELHSGKYFADCKLYVPLKIARDRVAAAKLWKLSEEVTGHSVN